MNNPQVLLRIVREANIRLQPTHCLYSTYFFHSRRKSYNSRGTKYSLLVKEASCGFGGNSLLPPCRSQSTIQNSIDGIVRNQTGIFKTLSESTPVEYMQNFIVNLHETSGLPWWATIVCATVLLRTCVTLPLAIHQSYILAKLENLKLEMPEIVQELKRETAMAIKMYNWDEKMARVTYNRSVRQQWNDLIVRDNCHPFKASLLLWFQIPMWVSLSISLRNLCYMLPNQDIAAHLMFSQLSMGGFGWIPNLTVVDSSLIFPVTLGIINLIIIELQMLSKVNQPTKFQRYVTNFFRGFSILMIPIAASVPSCLVLYWTTSSAYGLVQNLVLMSPKVKRFCKIPYTNKELEQPYAHILTGIKHKLSL